MMAEELTTEKTIVVSNPNGVISIPDYRSATFEQEVELVSETEVRVTIRTGRPGEFRQSYPIGTLPASASGYVEPTPHIQSGHPRIAEIAKEILAETAPQTQQELVHAVLRWNRDHLRWALPDEVPDALTALQRGTGNCIAFTHLPAAILRHLGVPVRTARTFIARPDANALIRHYLLEVYYAADGVWATYEPQIPGLPYTSSLYLYHDADWSVAGQRRTRPFSEDPATTVRYGRRRTAVPVQTDAARLPLSDDGADRFLGGTIAVGEETVVVGAFQGGNPWNAALSGEAHVYEQGRDGVWQADTVISRAPIASLLSARVVEYEGMSLARRASPHELSMHGRYAVANAAVLRSATPHVFERRGSQWRHVQALAPPAGTSLDRFGHVVAMGEDVAVVGTHRDRDDQWGRETCEAYVYERDAEGTWQWATQLAPVGDAGRYDFKTYADARYELSVSCEQRVVVEGDRVLVGTFYRGRMGMRRGDHLVDPSPTWTTNDEPQGSIHVFERGSDGAWGKTATLKSTAAANRHCVFPASVAFQGSRIAAGASSCAQGTDHVALYTLQGDAWTASSWLDPPDELGPRMVFGTAIALHGSTLAVATQRGRSASQWATPPVFLYERAPDGTWRTVHRVDAPSEAVNLQRGALAVEGPAESLLLQRRQSGWQTVAKLKQHDDGVRDQWRRPPGVAIDGNVMLVAEHRVGTQRRPDHGDANVTVIKTHPAPQAAVYERGTGGKWRRKATLRPPASDMITRGGTPVALDGNHALIGVRGAAHVFLRRGDGWHAATRLEPDDRFAGGFGETVALDGHTILVGAKDTGVKPPNGDYMGSTGAVYVFEGRDDCWTKIARLAPSDPQAYSYFGGSIAVDGGIAVAGASQHNGNGEKAGAAYVFERQSDGRWAETASLVPMKTGAEDYVGGSVAVQDGVALIGAYGSTTGAGIPHRGVAYAFRRVEDGTWSEAAVLGASGAASTELLGQPIALRGTTVALGSRSLRARRGMTNGAVYVQPLRLQGALPSVVQPSSTPCSAR